MQTSNYLRLKSMQKNIILSSRSPGLKLESEKKQKQKTTNQTPVPQHPMSTLFFAVACSAVAILSVAMDVHTFPSGRQIEVSPISKRYPDYERSSLPMRLYEFTSSKVLRGRNTSIDIGSNILSTIAFSKPKHTEIEIDRQVRKELNISGLLHLGARFSYVSLNDGTPISVHVPGLNLSPADHRLYPGIFIQHGAVPLARRDGTDVLERDNLKVSRVRNHSQKIESSNWGPTGTARQTASCANINPGREVELAIDFDSTYCKQNGADAATATTAIMALMEIVQQPYSESTCIKFKVVKVRGFCAEDTDPYREAVETYSSTTIIGALRSQWVSKDSDIVRDTVHLVSGFQKGPNGGKGIAYVGVMCQNSNGYGWSEPRKEIVAHEIAHNLGADHTDSGIMVEVQDGSQDFKFSETSVNEIVSYVDGLSESCLSTVGKEDSQNRDDNNDKPRPSPTSSSRAEPPRQPLAGDSCMSAFGTDIDSSAPNCKTFKIKNENAKIRISQQFGRLDAKVKLAGKPTEIGGIITMDPNVNPSSIPRKRYSNSASKISVSLDDLTIPSGSNTCCNEEIFLHVSAQVVKRKQSSEISFSQSILLACYNPCKGKQRRAVAQPSSRRRCAKCARA